MRRASQPIIRPIGKLEGQGDRLDVADDAPVEFHIESTFDCHASVAHRLRQMHTRESTFDTYVGREYRRLDLFKKVPEDTRITGARTRPDQNLALPITGFAGIVADRVFERDRERADAPVGPQSQIDAVRTPFTGLLSDELDDRLA